MHYELYTDGGCSKPGGPGGWAFVMRCCSTDKTTTASGGMASTTTNKMELLAAINGLLVLDKPSKIKLVSDSQYLVRGMTEWLPNWKARQWRTAMGKPILNAELWQLLSELLSIHEVEAVWVKGHTGHTYNEKCDSLCTEEIEKLKKELDTSTNGSENSI